VYVHITGDHTDVLYIYFLYIQYIYISLQHIYLFLMQQECKILETILFDMVHSHKLVVGLLHKHFTSRHSTVFNSISIITQWRSCSDCAASRLRVRFQMVSLKVFINII